MHWLATMDAPGTLWCNWWGPTTLSWEVVQGGGGRDPVLVAGSVDCVRPELARLPHMCGAFRLV